LAGGGDQLETSATVNVGQIVSSALGHIRIIAGIIKWVPKKNKKQKKNRGTENETETGTRTDGDMETRFQVPGSSGQQKICLYLIVHKDTHVWTNPFGRPTFIC